MLDPRIILSGAQPNLTNAFAQGQLAGAQSGRIKEENALREFLRQNGPRVAQGDENALAGLAAFNPQAALGVQNSIIGNRTAEFNLQNAKQQARAQAAARAAGLSASQRKAEQEKIERGIAAATAANTPEEFDRAMRLTGNDQFVGRFEDKDILVAMALGTKEALALNAPLSPEGELEADRRAGRLGDGVGGETPLDALSMQVFGARLDTLPKPTQDRVTELFALSPNPTREQIRDVLGPDINALQQRVEILRRTGVPEDVIDDIVSGRVVIRQNQETGLITFVDIAEQRVVSTLNPEEFSVDQGPTDTGAAVVPQSSVAQQAVTPPPEAQQPAQQSPDTPAPLTPRSPPDFSGTTGAPGVIANFANMGASLLGMDLPAPQANEARNRLDSLVSRTAVTLATSLQTGRPALATIESFKSTLPSPGSPFAGPEVALSQVRNTIDQLGRQLGDTLRVARSPDQFSKTTVSNARAKAIDLTSTLDEWRSVERAMDAEISGLTEPSETPPQSFLNDPRVKKTAEENGFTPAQLWNALPPSTRERFAQ